jgi:hypothetical protein
LSVRIPYTHVSTPFALHGETSAGAAELEDFDDEFEEF